MNPVRVEVNDKMQKGYVYLRTKPIGRAFRPGFTPELTPRQMLRLGVFGGKYMTDCRKEFPTSWFTRAKLSPARRDPLLNFFGVDASQPRSVWRKKGWLHPDDPRGWFQWYCRYYMGRRIPEEDARQRPSGGTSHRSDGTVSPATRDAGRVSAKRYCTGPTTAARFETNVPSLPCQVCWRQVCRAKSAVKSAVCWWRERCALTRRGRPVLRSTRARRNG